MNIDNKIFDEIETTNRFSNSKKRKIDMKIYELIVNDLDSLINLCKIYLEKFQTKRKNSILNTAEHKNNLINFRTDLQANDFKSNFDNKKKVKFSSETEESDKNSLSYLNNKFQLFYEEINKIKNLMIKKLKFELN